MRYHVVYAYVRANVLAKHNAERFLRTLSPCCDKGATHSPPCLLCCL